MFLPDPIGLPGLAALAFGFLLFVVAVLAARYARGRDTGEAGARHSPLSALGIAVQGMGIAAVGLGRQRVVLDPLGAPALADAVAVLLLMGGAVALFVWASRTMGRNWSIVARTRADHQLVQDGPFAHVRHPIYIAIGLLVPAIAFATGHARQLGIALPLYAIGTGIRVYLEERLLHDQFPEAYPAYAARVRRFVPGVI